MSKLVNGYKLDETGRIVGCSFENYKKPKEQQFKEIIKELLKR